MEDVKRKIFENLAGQGAKALSAMQKKLEQSLSEGQPKNVQELSDRLRNLLSFSSYLTSQVKMPPRKGVQIAEDTLCASRFSARTISDFVCPARLRIESAVPNSERLLQTLEKFIENRDVLFLRTTEVKDEQERKEAFLSLCAHFYQFFRCWQRSQTAVKLHKEKQREQIRGTSDALNLLKALDSPMAQMQFLYELCVEETEHYKADKEAGILNTPEGQYVEPIFDLTTYLHLLAPPRSCYYFHIQELIRSAKLQDWAVKELESFNAKRVALSNTVLERMLVDPDFVHVLEDGFRLSDPNAEYYGAEESEDTEEESESRDEEAASVENQESDGEGDLTADEKKRRLFSGLGMRFPVAAEKK